MAGLHEQQQGVLWRIGVGAAISGGVLAFVYFNNPFGFIEPVALAERLQMLAYATLVLGLAVVFAVARVARWRWLNTADIDGALGLNSSEHVRVLQAQLQNTLEQSLIAFFVYFAWSLLMPAHSLSTVPAAASLFIVGRALFSLNYQHGAAARALGFALTFYPSVIMLLLMLIYSVGG